MSGAYSDAAAEHGDGAAQERVFAALPPARGRGFARTWWGVSWQRALEESALDGAQLRRGRQVARSGAVGAVSVRPGRITAVVRDRDGTALRADVTVPQLPEDDWARLLGVITRTAGHLAALLDGEMTPELVADAEAADVTLLPGMGDLQAECACGEWDHCLHTAAVCYQLARLLDQDPFLLLLLLGRGRAALLAELRQLSLAPAAGSPAAGPAATGVPAAEVYAAPLAPLPEPPPVGGPVDVPPLADAPPGAGPGAPDPVALELLVRATAERAGALLAEALAPDHAHTAPAAEPGRWPDAVRLAATAGADVPLAERLARGCGRASEDLEVALAAWRFGGEPALAALEEPARPGYGPAGADGARARDRLATAWAPEEERPRLEQEGNRWTAPAYGLQLRHTPDGRWWPYRRAGSRWWPAGPAGHDPALLLAEFGCP